MKVYTKQSKWGTLRTDRKPAFLCFVDIIMIIMLIVAAGLYWFAVENGLPFWIGLLVLVLWTPPYAIMRTLARKEWKQFCKQMREAPVESTGDADEDTPETLPALTVEEKFYNKCVENQIITIDAAGVARMKLLAKQLKMDCSDEDLIEKFQKGSAGAENRMQILERNQKRLKLKTLHEQEQLEERMSKKFIDSVGSSKRVNECMDQVLQYQSKIRQLKKDAEDYTKKMSAIGAAYTQKETDWAFHGGIASGIAGTAAGVAVAADIQRKNAEVRAANEQLREAVTNAAGSYLAQNQIQRIELEAQAAYWEKQAEQAKLKLVAQKPQKELLTMLAPRVIDAVRSETGAMTITVSTKAASLIIYETVKATVDGSFKVKLMDGERIAGEAYFTLPFKGSENSAELKSICTLVSKEQKSYSFEVEPHNLFAIEL